MNRWYKIDNAGKLFPATAKKSNTSVFRVSFTLTEHVNPILLQRAVDIVMKRFPTFGVKIQSGVFWSYLKENNYRLVVSEEVDYPCCEIKGSRNNLHLIRILYLKRKISLEAFHVITDGSGATQFLKTLVHQYLCLTGKEIDHQNMILLSDTRPSKYEMEDSFNAYFKGEKNKRKEEIKAFQIVGSTFETAGNNVIHGIMSAQKLHAIAKKNGASVTAYLTAVLIYSIYWQSMKYGVYDDLIAIALPINLRKIFPSKTLRNFVGVTNVGVRVCEEFTMPYVIEQVVQQIKSGVEKDVLYGDASANILFEHLLPARITPLFIKNLGIKIVSKRYGQKAKTMTLSNIGRVEIPDDMEQYIEKMDFVLFPTKASPITCAVATVGDKLNVSFTRNIMEVEIIECFFTYLANEEHLDVQISSNNWGY